jgi:hypothetical protein
MPLDSDAQRAPGSVRPSTWVDRALRPDSVGLEFWVDRAFQPDRPDRSRTGPSDRGRAGRRNSARSDGPCAKPPRPNRAKVLHIANGRRFSMQLDIYQSIARSYGTNPTGSWDGRMVDPEPRVNRWNSKAAGPPRIPRRNPRHDNVLCKATERTQRLDSPRVPESHRDGDPAILEVPPPSRVSWPETPTQVQKRQGPAHRYETNPTARFSGSRSRRVAPYVH